MGSKRSFFKGLQGKLMTWFLVLSIIPIVVVGAIAYFNSSASLHRQIANQLESVEHLKGAQIEDYFREKEEAVHALANIPIISDELEIMEKMWEASGMELSQFVRSPEYIAEAKKLDQFLKTYVKDLHFYDAFILDHRGDLLFSASHEADFGTNLVTGKYKDTNLGRLVQLILKEGKAHLTDFERYAPSNDAPAAFIAQPILEANGELHGIVAVQVSIEDIDHNYAVGRGSR